MKLEKVRAGRLQESQQYGCYTKANLNYSLVSEDIYPKIVVTE